MLHGPSPRRKPGPPKLAKRGHRRPVDSIQGVPAFAGMTDLGDVVTFAGMTEVEQGDLLAVMTAGAYGAAQSGTYNS